MIINPTVGRVVWGWGLKGAVLNDIEPFACTVVKVWDDRMVNLSYFDHMGQHLSQTSVQLLQEGDAHPNFPTPSQHDRKAPFCEWMPYQQGQAKAQQPPKNDFDKD